MATTRSLRDVSFAFVLGLGVAACASPAPSEPALTTAPATSSASPSSVASPSPSGDSPSVSPEAPDTPGLAPLALEAEIAVGGVFALAPAQDGNAWFVAPGSPGTVGLLGRAGVVRSAETGPVPFDVAAAGDSVYVLEGMPDTGGTGVPRTQCLERLDASTLALEATVDLPDLAMEIVHTDGLVWAIGVHGTVTAHDDRDLAEVWRGELDGGGPASIAATSDAVWAAIGNLDEGVVPHFVLGRIALGDAPALAVTEVPGSGVGPVLAAGTRAWIAVADDPVYDWLYRIEPDGAVGAPVFVPAPAAMAGADGRLWWVGVDGRVGAIDEATGARTPDYAIAGASGAAIAASGGSAYVGVGDRVIVFSLPASTGGE